MLFFGIISWVIYFCLTLQNTFQAMTPRSRGKIHNISNTIDLLASIPHNQKQIHTQHWSGKSPRFLGMTDNQKQQECLWHGIKNSHVGNIKKQKFSLHTWRFWSLIAMVTHYGMWVEDVSSMFFFLNSNAEWMLNESTFQTTQDWILHLQKLTTHLMRRKHPQQVDIHLTTL